MQGALCGGCLAARRVRPPGAAPRALLRRLAAPDQFPELQQLEFQMCWECEAMLRRIDLFRNRVWRSMQILCDYLKQTPDIQNHLDLTQHCSSNLRKTPVECTAYPDSSLQETVNLAEPTVYPLHEEIHIKTEDEDVFDPAQPTLGVPVKKEVAGVRDDAPPTRRKPKKLKKKSSRKQIERERQKIIEAEDQQSLIIHNSQNLTRPPMERTAFPDSSLLVTETPIEPSNLETENREEAHIKIEDHDVFDLVPPSPSFSVKEEMFGDLDDVPLARHKSKKSKKLKKKNSRKQTERERRKLIETERFEHTPPYAHSLVSEEQLQAWRREDRESERYQRLPHKCASCQLAYHFRDQLEQHNAMKHHVSLGPVTCDVCACRFAAEQEMQTHRELHYTHYECRYCEYFTRDIRNIHKHFNMEHSSVKYECKLCEAVFKTASHLRYHKDDKHGSRWPCKYCDKTFRLRNNMYAHMLIHKKLPEAPCPVCQKTMKNKYALKIHLKIHEEAKRTWYCQPCGTHYKTEMGYKNHLNTSMKHLTPDKLKFGCEECGRRFVTEKRRRRHHASVHLKKSEFQCDKCSKSYSTKLALKNHILQKHDDSYEGPVRDKICDICGKGFAVIGILKSHMRTHTGERPFQCELCPSAFSHRAALYTHNRLVHLKLKRKRTCKKKTQEMAYGLDPVYI